MRHPVSVGPTRAEAVEDVVGTLIACIGPDLTLAIITAFGGTRRRVPLNFPRTVGDEDATRANRDIADTSRADWLVLTVGVAAARKVIAEYRGVTLKVRSRRSGASGCCARKA